MIGATSPLSRTSSWPAEGQIYHLLGELHLSRILMFILTGYTQNIQHNVELGTNREFGKLTIDVCGRRTFRMRNDL